MDAVNGKPGGPGPLRKKGDKALLVFREGVQEQLRNGDAVRAKIGHHVLDVHPVEKAGA